jgi:pimeloyl-ACP methyl ester carboxylesterase
MEGSVTLPDGRRLGYAEYGDPSGKPLLFFPGTPHSRLSRPKEGTAEEAGLRFITVERPGFGISDFQQARKLLDWPADVVCLADQLRLEGFFVGGTSGGGPYVAACAYRIPERLLGAAIVAGLGPLSLPGATEGMARSRKSFALLFRRAPRLMQSIASVLPLHRYPHLLYGYMTRAMAAESDLLQSRWEERLADVSEALRPGLRGFAQELGIVSGDWGFGLEQIPVEVHVWHGEADVATPISMGQQMARAIPQSRPHFVPGAGHLLWQTHQKEILLTLTQWPAAKS